MGGREGWWGWFELQVTGRWDQSFGVYVGLLLSSLRSFPILWKLSAHHITRRDLRERLLIPAVEPAETRLDVGVEAALATGEANRILVAILAATQAGS